MEFQTTTVNDTSINESFSEELRYYWRALPNKTFFFLLLIAWLALFQFLGNSTFGYVDTPSLFHWMFNAYNTKTDVADDSYGNLVPFVVLGLMWWKRKELVSQQLKTWWPGLLLVALAVLLHITGYMIQQSRLSVVALFVGIYGLMGLAWGPGWLRACFFPFFLFAFSVPLGSLTEPVTFPLRMAVSRIVEFIGQDVLGFNVVREGTRLFKPPTAFSEGYDYEVAAACGGIRSLIAISGIAIVYGFMVFKNNWKRAVLILSSAPLAVIGNTLRLLVVVITAEFWGKEAGLRVHDNTVLSLVPYVPAIVGLMLIGRWLENMSQQTAPSQNKPDGEQKTT